jgi:hypothetical protein
MSGNKYRVTDGCKETGMWKKKCSEGYVVVTARQKCAFIEFQVTYCNGSVLSDGEMACRRANLYISNKIFGGGGKRRKGFGSLLIRHNPTI